MNAVVIIVGVVAVVIIAAVVFWIRWAAARRAGAEEEREPTPAGEVGEAKVRSPEGATRAPAATEPEPEVARAEEAKAPEIAEAEGTAVRAPEATEPAKPEPTEAELRSRFETRLADSERMLNELREVVTEGGELPVDTGSVDIMAEGLKEVRSLAERKRWDQARDKGEALHAQLTLLLQSARRERTS